MRLVPGIAASWLFSLPTLSLAYCFSVYTPQNQLVYQSTTTPIDLSRPISAGLSARYPNHHLVFIPDQSRCTPVGTLAFPGSAPPGEAGTSITASLEAASRRPPRARADRQ